jgi:hypothetical protein
MYNYCAENIAQSAYSWFYIRGVIVVHQVYNNHTTPLHKGWAPYTVGPTPCEWMLYDSCTLGVQLSLFFT